MHKSFARAFCVATAALLTPSCLVVRTSGAPSSAAPSTTTAPVKASASIDPRVPHHRASGRGAPATLSPDPFGSTPCPSSLPYDPGPRTFDAREGHATLPAPYAKQHMRPVTDAEKLAHDDAVARILELEAKTPGLVPQAFRTDLAEHGKDPSFRLYMSRCEAAEQPTARRAAYDAAIAYLVGAPNDVAMGFLQKSLFPVEGMHSCGHGVSCSASFTCDSVEESCSNARIHAARMASKAELELEDALVRALVAMQAPDMLQKNRMTDVAVYFPSNYLAHCGTAYCHVKPGLPPNAQSWHDPHVAVWWDRRYHGESHELPLDDAEKACKKASGEIDRDRCLAVCGGAPMCARTCSACPNHMN